MLWFFFKYYTIGTKGTYGREDRRNMWSNLILIYEIQLWMACWEQESWKSLLENKLYIEIHYAHVLYQMGLCPYQ